MLKKRAEIQTELEWSVIGSNA